MVSCVNGGGNGEGEGCVGLGGVHAQGPKQFLFQPRKHLSVTLLLLCTKTFVV